MTNDKDDHGNFKELKERLLLDIGNAQHFRAKKSAEYPDDRRNAKSAESLEKLEIFVAGLPDSHALFTGLIILASEENENYHEWLNARLVLYGFAGEDAPATFIDEMLGKMHNPQSSQQMH